MDITKYTVYQPAKAAALAVGYLASFRVMTERGERIARGEVVSTRRTAVWEIEVTTRDKDGKEWTNRIPAARQVRLYAEFLEPTYVAELTALGEGGCGLDEEFYTRFVEGLRKDFTTEQTHNIWAFSVSPIRS